MKSSIFPLAVIYIYIYIYRESVSRFSRGTVLNTLYIYIYIYIYYIFKIDNLLTFSMCKERIKGPAVSFDQTTKK